MQFDPGSTPPCFISEDGTVRIEKDSEVRLRIVGTRVDATEIVSKEREERGKQQIQGGISYCKIVITFFLSISLLYMQFSIGSIKEDYLGIIQ